MRLKWSIIYFPAEVLSKVLKPSFNLSINSLRRFCAASGFSAKYITAFQLSMAPEF